MTTSEASRRRPLAFRASQNILRLEKQSDFIGHLYIVDPYSVVASGVGSAATAGGTHPLKRSIDSNTQTKKQEIEESEESRQRQAAKLAPLMP